MKGGNEIGKDEKSGRKVAEKCSREKHGMV
jgi:hypothetical protein